MNLLRLWQVTDRKDWRDKADAIFAALARRLDSAGPAVPQLAVALDFSLSKPKQIIIAGDPGGADTQAMLQLVHGRFIPNKILLLADGAPARRSSRGGCRLSGTSLAGTERRPHTSVRIMCAGCRRPISASRRSCWMGPGTRTRSGEALQITQDDCAPRSNDAPRPVARPYFAGAGAAAGAGPGLVPVMFTST